jgi:hypothetical protein
MSLLSKIHSPADLKAIPREQLPSWPRRFAPG